MIKKISHINLAVFRNFVWKEEFFNKINIIYGRNYSGKTTLSRIFRAMETGNLSDKYEKPSFTVSFEGGTEVTQDTYGEQNHEKTIRVFNEDFIRENLRFITDPDGDIKPFAVLGKENVQIEKEIENIKNNLGSNEEGKETGLYRNRADAREKFKVAEKEYLKAEKEISEELRKISNSRTEGIRYNRDYDVPNYDIRDLDKDILQIQENYLPLEKKQVSECENSIKERKLPPVPLQSSLNLHFQQLADSTNKLVAQSVSESGKIDELVKDSNLNKWVETGINLHEAKEDKKHCAFCTNKISDERWDLLKKHFDERSDKLKSDIGEVISKVKEEEGIVNLTYIKDNSEFYSFCHNDLNEMRKSLEKFKKAYIVSLKSLIAQLEKKSEDLFSSHEFNLPNNVSETLIEIWDSYKKICEKSNAHIQKVDIRKNEAREKLRLDKVYQSTKNIGYETKKNNIDNLKKKKEIAEKKKEDINNQISEEEKKIRNKQRELNDEEKGALAVNEYLKNCFDHYPLSLEAKEDNIDEEVSACVRFEIMRNGKKAYHLSEGECNLLAFCYFIAKLEDTNTKGSNPTIWIDDPISSLDGNHIFLIYSLIDSEIISKSRYEQIFVSTHSLEFLRYLSQLGDREDRNNNSAHFLVERLNQNSTIRVMPKYIKEFFTEFNYLFRVIYKCAYPKESDEKSLSYFYIFGNNARRFLEIYLYYKYPTDIKFNKKLELFFRDGSLVKLINRIINEYSHSKILEGGLSPNESEIKTVAKKITDRLRETDIEQYKALCKSVETDL